MVWQELQISDSLVHFLILFFSGMYHRSVSNSIPQSELEYTIRYFILQYQNTPPIFKIIYFRSLEAVVTLGFLFF